MKVKQDSKLIFSVYEVASLFLITAILGELVGSALFYRHQYSNPNCSKLSDSTLTNTGLKKLGGQVKEYQVTVRGKNQRVITLSEGDELSYRLNTSIKVKGCVPYGFKPDLSLDVSKNPRKPDKTITVSVFSETLK